MLYLFYFYVLYQNFDFRTSAEQDLNYGSLRKLIPTRSVRVVLAVEGNNFVADPDPEGELDDVRVGVRTRKSEVPGRLFVRHVRKQLNLAENSNKFLAGKFKPSFGGKFNLKLGGKL